MFTSDAHDILGDAAGTSSTTTRRPRRPQPSALGPSSLGSTKDKQVTAAALAKVRRPAGISRELYNLYVHQGKDGNNSKEKIEALIPTNTKRGYTVVKAQLGKRVVHKWVMQPFSNEARTDGLQLPHWERQDKLEQPYQFARFNKQLEPVTFTPEEYEDYLVDARWTKEETLHLLELCQRFDLRWPIVADRFDHEQFGGGGGGEKQQRKSMEDMKERYYGIVNELNAARGTEAADPMGYDADHERRRKEQLNKLWDRTEEQIKEEEDLKEAVKRIEGKRKDRERKAHDLQRLINAAERVSVSPDSSVAGTPTMGGSIGRPQHRRSTLMKKGGLGGPLLASQLMPGEPHIRWPEYRQPGPHLRSQEMKLPSNTAQRKLNNIGVVVTKLQIVSLGIEYPHAYEEIVKLYNDFRSNVVLLQELKTAVFNMEQELDQAAHRLAAEKGMQVSIEPRFRVSDAFYDELEQNPGQLLGSPKPPAVEETGGKGKGKGKGKQQQQPKLAPVTNRRITRLIEVNPSSVAQTRKRRIQATPSSSSAITITGGGGTSPARSSVSFATPQK